MFCHPEHRSARTDTPPRVRQYGNRGQAPARVDQDLTKPAPGRTRPHPMARPDHGRRAPPRRVRLRRRTPSPTAPPCPCSGCATAATPTSGASRSTWPAKTDTKTPTCPAATPPAPPRKHSTAPAASTSTTHRLDPTPDELTPSSTKPDQNPARAAGGRIPLAGVRPQRCTGSPLGTGPRSPSGSTLRQQRPHEGSLIAQHTAALVPDTVRRDEVGV